ncbi:MAG: hypothetical protein AAF713_07625 [Pseudomonadota bacterium]
MTEFKRAPGLEDEEPEVEKTFPKSPFATSPFENSPMSQATAAVEVAEGVPGPSDGDQPVVDGFGSAILVIAAVVMMLVLLIAFGSGASKRGKAAREGGTLEHSASFGDAGGD